MKQIKEIVESIREELESAEDYAKKATRYKLDDKTLADTYYEMSMQELGHVDRLHAQAVRLIKSQTEPAPAAMQAVWDWEHDKMIDTTARVKTLLTSYKQ